MKSILNPAVVSRRTHRSLLLGGMLLGVGSMALFASACTSGESDPFPIIETPDVASPDGGTPDAGEPDADDPDTGTPDTGDAGPDVIAEPPPVSATSLCASAGVARGGGLTLYGCTGLAAPTGVATGDGFTLHSGTTRLVTP